MFGKGLKLFRLFGFEVKVDFTWTFLAVLITWSLAAGFFPVMYEGLATGTYWAMGVAGALGLFASIVFHELSHSLVARAYDFRIKGITLFIFGGVAQMEEEPPSAKTEFLMAIAGPISSYVLAGGFYLLYGVAGALALGTPVVAVLYYLGLINLVLATFNLIPAFPLDGGRVLRSLLWWANGNLRSATRAATVSGTVFGGVLIALGLFSFISGNPVGGVWQFLLGLFIISAARMTYQQMLMREMLGGEPVRRFMKTEPVTVQPDATLEAFVEETVYRHHHKLYPVVEADGTLRGFVHARDVRNFPREEWAQRTVSELAEAGTPENTVRPDSDAMHALALMQRSGRSRMLVMDGDRLAGVLALKDLLEFFQMKVDLEADNDRPGSFPGLRGTEGGSRERPAA